MELQEQILGVIKAIRESVPIRIQCWQFHKILRSIYGNAEPHYDGDHIVTLIDSVKYDIDGVVKNPSHYIPMSEFGNTFIDDLENAYDGYYQYQFDKMQPLPDMTTTEQLNQLIETLKRQGILDASGISDGENTFQRLYDRIAKLEGVEKETPDEYLARLIEKARPTMQQIGDPEKWLAEVRGHEDEDISNI